MSNHANTVREIYEAFGRGDVPTILANSTATNISGLNA